MKTFFFGMGLAMSFAMLLSLYRVFRGPTHFDRLIGLGLIGTKTVVILVLLGVFTHVAGFWVDIALAYALICFIGTLALAKFFETGGRI
ncbi:monovalent cation/H+ antiporter complex subunit F [Elusimicrobiota bacterium]